jgi:hypothetical protein
MRDEKKGVRVQKVFVPVNKRQLPETQSRNPVVTTCAVVTGLRLYGYNCAMGQCVSLIPVENHILLLTFVDPRLHVA